MTTRIWTTYNVTGSQEWEVVSFGNPAPSANGCLDTVVSAGDVNEDWLVSPAIDLSGAGNVYINFDSVNRSYDGERHRSISMQQTTLMEPKLRRLTWTKSIIHSLKMFHWYAFGCWIGQVSG